MLSTKKRHRTKKIFSKDKTQVLALTNKYKNSNISNINKRQSQAT